jgi:hypothetical protein
MELIAFVGIVDRCLNVAPGEIEERNDGDGLERRRARISDVEEEREECV